MKQWIMVLVIALGAGLTVLVLISRPGVNGLPSESLSIGEPSPPCLSPNAVSGSGSSGLSPGAEVSEAPKFNNISDGNRFSEYIATRSTELGMCKSDQLPIDEHPPESDLEQDLNEAAASATRHSDSDIDDSDGEEFLSEILESALVDSNNEVRRQAVEEAATLRSDAALELLIIALQDADAEIRVEAIDSLGRLLSEGFGDEEQVLGALLEATFDPDPNVTLAAFLLVRDRFRSDVAVGETPGENEIDSTEMDHYPSVD